MRSKYISARYSNVSLGAIALACCLASGVMTQASAATAQSPDVPQGSSAGTAGDDVGVGAIVVTARRVEENLQDVPQQVTAATGEDLSKLSITQFENIAAIVPALTLGNDGYGFPAPSIRGVPFDAIASVNPTVDIYLNEVPVQVGMAFSGFYDIDNIQVLAGPQGTARGRTAPSGAILLNSRRPNLDEFGGYVSGLAAEFDEYNAQGAVNVPVIPGKFAVRVAGLYSKNPGDFVRSVNSRVDANRRDVGARVTALFKPSDDFDVLVTYQHHDQKRTYFPAVFGDGSPGATYTDAGGNVVPNPFAPPGYNGPSISPFDRLAVADFPSRQDFKYDFVTGQINAKLFGQNLTYIGGYYEFTGRRKVAGDPGNLIIGQGWFQEGPEPAKQLTQEVRLSSETGGFFDYTVGYFYSHIKGTAATQNEVAFLPGAFGVAQGLGAPVPADPRTVNTYYMFPLVTNAPLKRSENSVFASVTLRPGPATEITLGGRYLFLDNFSGVTIGLGQAAALATPNFGLPCSSLAAGLVPSNYAGYCDFIIPAGAPTSYVNREKRKPFIYSASISHHFTDDIMAYGTVASSYRLGFPSVAVHNADGDPTLANLLFPRPEKSTSFEVGLKTNWFDNRVRVNIALFYQKFKDLLFTTQPVPYRNVTSVAPQRLDEVDTAQFNANGDAVSKGLNLDVAFQPTRHFSISGQVAYAKTKLDNAQVPCRDVNFDGIADSAGTPALQDFINAGVYVARCNSNAVITRDPLWRATVQSELSQPINPQMDGYLRGLLTYYSSNSNRSSGFTADNYAMLTLYAGVRSTNGAWDLGLFLRNATNTKVQLSQGEDDLSLGLTTPFGLAGYRTTSVTPPRQFGVTLRYAFGSR